MAYSFIDLGAGYFAYEDHGWHVRTVVLDSHAREQDHFFGPAAWGGERGPCAGKRVCEAVPTRVGHYDQVSEHEWKWCMPDGTELDVEPPSWPRRVSVDDSAESKALLRLDGIEFPDEAALHLALKDALSSMERKVLFSTSTHGRLAGFKFAHPHIFVEEPIFTSVADNRPTD